MLEQDPKSWGWSPIDRANHRTACERTIAVRGGPFDTRGGGLWFFFLSKLFLSFPRPNNKFFSIVDPNKILFPLGHETFHRFAELYIFFPCVVSTNFFCTICWTNFFFLFWPPPPKPIAPPPRVSNGPPLRCTRRRSNESWLNQTHHWEVFRSLWSDVNVCYIRVSGWSWRVMTYSDY